MFSCFIQPLVCLFILILLAVHRSTYYTLYSSFTIAWLVLSFFSARFILHTPFYLLYTNAFSLTALCPLQPGLFSRFLIRCTTFSTVDTYWRHGLVATTGGSCGLFRGLICCVATGSKLMVECVGSRLKSKRHYQICIHVVHPCIDCCSARARIRQCGAVAQCDRDPRLVDGVLVSVECTFRVFGGVHGWWKCTRFEWRAFGVHCSLLSLILFGFVNS